MDTGFEHFTKEGGKWTHEKFLFMTSCYINREMQIKIGMKYYYTPVPVPKRYNFCERTWAKDTFIYS